MTSFLLSLYFSLRSVLLNNFFRNIKVTYWSVLILILKMFIQFVWSHGLLITLSDDIGTNPRPKPNPSHNFSVFHWNVNSLIAYNYLKGSLLRAYIVIKKFEVLCLSETYLNSYNLFDDEKFNLPGYNIVRVNYLPNTKRWCLDLLQELFPFEGSWYSTFVRIWNKKLRTRHVILSPLYRFPSQSKDESESFPDKFELNCDSVVISFVLGNVNANKTIA